MMAVERGTQAWAFRFALIGLLTTPACGPQLHGLPPEPAERPAVRPSVQEPPAKTEPVGRLPAGIKPAVGQAFFELETILGDKFVFALTDPGRIRQARDIVARRLPKRVSGAIVAKAQPYNRPWHFHLDPATIEFTYLTDDSCHAEAHDVEEHLAEVGTRFLPRSRWCPLSSRIVRELIPAQ